MLYYTWQKGLSALTFPLIVPVENTCSMLNGKQHGYGISLRADGTMYKGQWSTGRESGEGELTGVDGNIIYKGEFLDGYFSGPGQYFFSNGDVYTGMAIWCNLLNFMSTTFWYRLI